MPRSRAERGGGAEDKAEITSGQAKIEQWVVKQWEKKGEPKEAL